MITYIKGNIFESPAQVITNTVNTQGVMGKGIALEFKKRYPEMFKFYKEKCDVQELKIGSLMLYKENEKWILLFPTKNEWRKKSELSYIEKGLRKFADNWDKQGINSIAFPKLGCGNGGLDWKDVKPLMEKYLRPLPIDVYIYTDNYEPKREISDEKTDMEKWLSGENELSGYSLFWHKCSELLKDQEIIKLSDSHICRLSSEDAFSIDGKDIDPELIIKAWNYARDAKILSREEAIGYMDGVLIPVLEIMEKLNYVIRIYASRDDNNYTKIPNAYQYIAA